MRPIYHFKSLGLHSKHASHAFQDPGGGGGGALIPHYCR